MEPKVKRQRAPNGYRIIQWADGFYQVYCGGECLAEVLTREGAVMVAIAHKNDEAIPPLPPFAPPDKAQGA